MHRCDAVEWQDKGLEPAVDGLQAIARSPLVRRSPLHQRRGSISSASDITSQMLCWQTRPWMRFENSASITKNSRSEQHYTEDPMEPIS